MGKRNFKIHQMFHQFLQISCALFIWHKILLSGFQTWNCFSTCNTMFPYMLLNHKFWIENFFQYKNWRLENLCRCFKFESTNINITNCTYIIWRINDFRRNSMCGKFRFLQIKYTHLLFSLRHFFFIILLTSTCTVNWLYVCFVGVFQDSMIHNLYIVCFGTNKRRKLVSFQNNIIIISWTVWYISCAIWINNILNINERIKFSIEKR